MTLSFVRRTLHQLLFILLLLDGATYQGVGVRGACLISCIAGVATGGRMSENSSNLLKARTTSGKRGLIFHALVEKNAFRCF